MGARTPDSLSGSAGPAASGHTNPPAAPSARATPAGLDGLLNGAAIVTHDAAVSSATSAAATPGAATPGALPPEWRRLQVYGGGLLLALCFALFGWQFWRGRDPAPVTLQPVHAGSGAEIAVHVAGAVAAPGVYRLSQGARVEDAIRAAGGLTADADASRLNLALRLRDEQRVDIPFIQPPITGPGESASQAGAPPAPPDSNASAVPAPGSGVPVAPLTLRATSTPHLAPAPRPSATPRLARPSPAPAATARPDGKVNVNVATKAQLEQLPGIGDVSAQRILDYRATHGRLSSLDDLRRAGISDALIRRAADYIAFD